MKRELYIKLFRCISIVLITAFVFYIYLPKRNWPISDMNETVGRDKLDVICFGSSHMYDGLNPVQLYKEHGIASYIVAVGGQAPWQTYYYIKQACKYQKPKVVICDMYIFGTYQGHNAFDDSQTVRNLLNCPFSLDKLLAVTASEADSKLSIILNFPYSHDDEFKGFSLNKIYGKENALMGYEFKKDIEPATVGDDVENVNTVRPIDVKNEKYLGKIINYCKNNQIELVLTNTPWAGITENVEEYFNYIAAFAAESDVTFIDGCKLYKEMGIDYNRDCSEAGGHLNYYGVSKYTSWFGKNVLANYGLPDRRACAGYEMYKEGDKEIRELLVQ